VRRVRQRRGFTLVELFAALAIISIFTTVFIGSVVKLTHVQRQVGTKAEAIQLVGNAFERARSLDTADPARLTQLLAAESKATPGLDATLRKDGDAVVVEVRNVKDTVVYRLEVPAK